MWDASHVADDRLERTGGDASMENTCFSIALRAYCPFSAIVDRLDVY